MLVCKVSGAKSKQAARALAKKLACAQKLKSSLLNGKCEAIDILYEANSITEDMNIQKAQITLGAGENTYALFDSGRTLTLRKETVDSLLLEKEILLSVELGAGNFGATSYSCITP